MEHALVELRPRIIRRYGEDVYQDIWSRLLECPPPVNICVGKVIWRVARDVNCTQQRRRSIEQHHQRRIAARLEQESEGLQCVERDDLLKQMRACLLLLPIAVRRVIQLLLAGYCHAEIARILRKSESTVRNQHALAVKRLRGLLKFE